MRLCLPHFPSLLVAVSLAGLAVRVDLAGQDSPGNLKQADQEFREGVTALSHNDLATAQTRFEAVVKLAPSVEQGHSALGVVLAREGRLSAGIHELQKALVIKPDDGAAQLNLALAFEQSGAPAEALPWFAKVEATADAQRRSLPLNVLQAYVRALAAAGQRAAAIAKMKEAVTEFPDRAELHDQLGSLDAQGREWGPAESEFLEAIRLKPDLATAHLHLGFVYEAVQKPDAAGEWIKAYDLAPENVQIAMAVGKALADAGRDKQAVAVLEQAHRLEPRSSAAAYQLAFVLQRVDREQDAVALFKTVIAAEPQNVDALINLGLALCQLHQATDAVPFLQRAIALKPRNATAYEDLAAAYLQVNRVADAEAALRSGLKLSSDSAQLHYDLGVAYKLQDDAVNAIPELEAAEKLNPAGYEPEYVLGMLYLQVGRYREAAVQLETSLKLHPQNGEGWATLGSIYDKLDRLPDAVNALHQAIQQLPDQADSHLLLANVLMKQNQVEQAAAERKVGATLMRAHMNLQRAEVATNTGKSMMERGKTEDAMVEFRNALAFDPTFAEAHLELAKALEKQGKTIEAAAELAKARSLATTAK
ncbi:MAG TPA: tetratricopeptide repeat protein [Terracidiphilus sp.]|nr:tetratricopeptide repeat protein [Terracidiphilus sp.]